MARPRVLYTSARPSLHSRSRRFSLSRTINKLAKTTSSLNNLHTVQHNQLAGHSTDHPTIENPPRPINRFLPLSLFSVAVWCRANHNKQRFTLPLAKFCRIGAYLIAPDNGPLDVGVIAVVTVVVVRSHAGAERERRCRSRAVRGLVGRAFLRGKRHHIPGAGA